MTSCWKAGDVVVLRGLGQGMIWYALPVIVVKDTSELIALFWRAGTCGKWRMKPSLEKVTPLDVVTTPMDLIDRRWMDTDVLMLIAPTAAHAVYVMWEEGQKELLCWYINLQAPVCRTHMGLDTQDHWLDIVVSPDKTTWEWKDQDQLKEAVELGIYTEGRARSFRSEGERVIDLVQKNRPPFCDSWENWRAPSAWKIPVLPEGWDELRSFE